MVKLFKNIKLRQKITILIILVVVNLLLFLTPLTYEINKYYYIEETNNYRWQKFMNEEEFLQLEKGMTYMDVVKIAKGRGERLTDYSYLWYDELLLTKQYIITFEDHQLVGKFMYLKYQFE
ncbi:hypothetical protein UACE39S_05948 [Ureibacillus acetophenoni]